jgi:hypothetical protein
VLLTRRPAAEWVASRVKFGQAMNLPLDRPCGLTFADASAAESGVLLDAHDELVRCVVPQRQLMQIDIFRAARGSHT